jgi:trimeric autotransporter adhesin
MIRSIRFAALALLSTTLAVSPLTAQTIYGGLRGLITDSSGAAMSNAKVSLTNEGTADVRSAMTSTTGEYAFTQVTPGKYKISVEFSGFKKYERAGVGIETQQQLTVDVKMEVGNVNESVQVTEEVPLIETANASQGQVIDRQKLVDLPNLGRNPYMFSRLAPNVQQVGNPAYARMQDQSGSSQISIAGGPVRGNNYLLDGVAITDMANRAIIIASLEAVQEMKVQANTYDSEIGRSGGGMFNALMKSGTNTFHGSGGAYFRQTEWLANGFFANRAGRKIVDQPFRNYLGSFGGPVWIPKVYDGRNKTFFFFSFEGYRDTQANSGTTQVPTALERVGNFSNSFASAGGPLRMIYDPMSTTAEGVRTPFAGNIIPGDRVSPIGRAIAATFPAPDLTARFHGDNNRSYTGVLPSVADQRTYKLDHKLFSWWNASFGFQWYKSLEPGETWFPDSVSSPQQWRLGRIVHSSQLNNTMTINPTTVLAVRYGFNRFPNDSFQLSQGFNPATLGFNPGFLRDVASPTFPRVTFQNFYAGDAMGTDSNSLVIPYSKSFGAILSKFLGKHSLKFGTDVRRLNVSGINYANSAGNFGFTDNFTRQNFAAGDGRTGSDMASLLLGAPNAADGFIPTKLNNYLQYYSGFFQDDIRLNAKLTFNIGVRWERETGLKEVNNNLIVGFDRNAVNSISRTSGFSSPGAVMFAGLNGAPTQTSNPEQNKLSPRIGLAYQVNSKTTIRGGYGIFWGPQIALGAPYSPEGFTASTSAQTSADGNRTPLAAANLASIFSAGLDRPVGSNLADRTGIGKALAIFDQNARAPRVQQYSIDIQRELPFGIAASIAYVGSRSTQLTQTAGGININQVAPGFFNLGVAGLSAATANPYFGRGGSNGVAGATVNNAQLVRPFPSFGNITLNFADYNFARYDSMVVKAQKRMSNGLSMLFAWTWSKNFDATSGGAGNNLNGGNASPQNVYDLRSEYGLSYLDATHRISQTYTYELPIGKGKSFGAGMNKWADMAIGGWSINAVSVINSGFPLQITQNNNNNSIIFASSQRPSSAGVNPFNGGNLAQWTDGPAGGAYLKSSAFIATPALQFGNLSRTINVRSLRQVNWDMSLFKTFSVTERIKAQFRAEALNAMNTPMFRAPNVAFGSGAFGRITAQANFPRFIQLGFRVSF